VVTYAVVQLRLHVTHSSEPVLHRTDVQPRSRSAAQMCHVSVWYLKEPVRAAQFDCRLLTLA